MFVSFHVPHLLPQHRRQHARWTASGRNDERLTLMGGSELSSDWQTV